MFIFMFMNMNKEKDMDMYLDTDTAGRLGLTCGPDTPAPGGQVKFMFFPLPKKLCRRRLGFGLEGSVYVEFFHDEFEPRLQLQSVEAWNNPTSQKNMTQSVEFAPMLPEGICFRIRRLNPLATTALNQYL
jgi:hypothetical protein